MCIQVGISTKTRTSVTVNHYPVGVLGGSNFLPGYPTTPTSFFVCEMCDMCGLKGEHFLSEIYIKEVLLLYFSFLLRHKEFSQHKVKLTRLFSIIILDILVQSAFYDFQPIRTEKCKQIL